MLAFGATVLGSVPSYVGPPELRKLADSLQLRCKAETVDELRK